MTQELTALKQLIQKKLIKDLSFTSDDDDLSFRVTLTNLEYRELLKESAKIGVAKHELDKLIDQVKESIKFDTKIKETLKLIPANIKIGQYLRLRTHDQTGDATEEFICFGNSRFILVKHERGALEIMDELKSLTSPWNVGGFVDFEVYRNNKQIIREGNLNVYRTKTLKNIQILDPQFDFDAFYKTQFISEEQTIEKKEKNLGNN